VSHVVHLPALGESVTEGTVTRWLKSVGDTVALDEPLLEISTDKVDTEIPSPVAGTLLVIRVEEDDTVEVGAELAVIGSADALATPTAPTPPADNADVPVAASADAEPNTPSEARTSDATPIVRELTAERSPDPIDIEVTGVGDRAGKQDITAASSTAGLTSALSQEIAAAQPSPLRGRTEKLSNLRKVIASRMIESLQTSAQLTSVVEVDLTRVDRLRKATQDAFQAREGVRLTFTSFFAKAATDTLKTHPRINSSIDLESNEVIYHDAENLAIAVDTDRGLLTPVIKNAGDLSIIGLTKKLADIAERTRDNKVAPDELTGGTFTLTNTGSRGALFDTPIINQPQVAILATGAIVKRAVVVDDPNLGETIAVRKMMYLALTYDHRLIDGADAARFLGDVKARLESANFDL
jgi:pyruvate dehydrogenase E2 component (dihydrolipoamide acetyltransferase)